MPTVPLPVVTYSLQSEQEPDLFTIQQLQNQLEDHYINQIAQEPSSRQESSKAENSSNTNESNYQHYSIARKFHHEGDYSQDYIKTHKIWSPTVEADEILSSLHSTKTNDEPDQQTRRSREASDGSFSNYLYVPTLMGETPLPCLIHHTSCSLNNNIFIFGGSKNLFYPMKQSVNFKQLDLSNIIINPIAKLPFPLNNEFINNPLIIPNDDLYVVSSETNQVRLERNISGDVPPPLHCMSAVEITNRHIHYYGGFEFRDVVTIVDGKIIVKRNIHLNNSSYILDTVSLKFRKFELISHPTIITKQPITIPRFGHSIASVNISKHYEKPGDNEYVLPATVFVMGGYKQNDVDPTKFETLQDLWKIEFSITYQGKYEYIEFGETVLATPIHTQLSPPGRAFHISEILDSQYVFGDQLTSFPFNPNKIGVANPTSQPSNRKLNLRLIIHGGTNGFDVLGDVWWFDFDEETWARVDTYFPNFNYNDLSFDETLFKAQVKKVAHRSLIIDRHLILIGGAINSDFFHVEDDDNDDDFENYGVDISKLFLKFTTDTQLYHRLFVLNLTNQTWVLVKCFHHFQPTETDSKVSILGNIGSSITSSNSKVFLTGGQLILSPEIYSDTTEKIPHLLSSSVAIFEFPMGSFTNKSARRI